MPSRAPNYLSAGAQLGSAALPPDRRKRARLSVRWPLRFRDDAAESVTENLSSDGFYFHSSRALVPGEVRVCSLGLPGFPTDKQSGIEIECSVRIVRVEALATVPAYGVGCRILDFRVVRS